MSQPGRFGLVVRRDDLGDVAVEVADRRVQLGEGDPQAWPRGKASRSAAFEVAGDVDDEIGRHERVVAHRAAAGAELVNDSDRADLPGGSRRCRR